MFFNRSYIKQIICRVSCAMNKYNCFILSTTYGSIDTISNIILINFQHLSYDNIQLRSLSSEFFFFLQDNTKYPLAPAYHSAKSVKLTNDLIRVLRRQILIQFRRRKNLRRKKSWRENYFCEANANGGFFLTVA